MFIFNFAVTETIVYFHIISLSYFLYDTYYSWPDLLFTIHHIASIVLILANRYMANNNYNYYANLLLVVAESTGIFQNYFFLMKSHYGDTRKTEFNLKYANFFKLYSRAFILCRLIIAPLLIYTFLDSIQESVFWWMIAILGTCIMLASGYWIYGQHKMFQRMQKKPY